MLAHRSFWTLPPSANYRDVNGLNYLPPFCSCLFYALLPRLLYSLLQTSWIQLYLKYLCLPPTIFSAVPLRHASPQELFHNNFERKLSYATLLHTLLLIYLVKHIFLYLFNHQFIHSFPIIKSSSHIFIHLYIHQLINPSMLSSTNPFFF